MPIKFFHAFTGGVKAWHAAHRNILPLPELSEWTIPHKICFNASKQNQIKDFPQNSRKVKRVVIMNMGNSIASDLDRFLIQ